MWRSGRGFRSQRASAPAASRIEADREDGAGAHAGPHGDNLVCLLIGEDLVEQRSTACSAIHRRARSARVSRAGSRAPPTFFTVRRSVLSISDSRIGGDDVLGAPRSVHAESRSGGVELMSTG